MECAPIVIPVRFATRNVAVQTTTRELSAKGVLVRCLESPPVGTVLSMKLYLPGSRDGVQVEAAVRSMAPAGSDPGFWAEFTALGDPERAQIVETIARRERAAEAVPIGAVAVEPSGEDPRRAFPRYHASFPVKFATVQDFVLEYAANISAGGVFVHTEEAPPLKSVVKIEMELPGGGEPVPARGVIVHRVTLQDAKTRGTIPGIGVQFLDADDRFRDRINAAIDHILKKG
ncbi:MAG: PilZ domain-containing protein [Myxococcales bacterium]|nr:PilZ domain-containing protein [Myxococcales bacterium]